MKMVKVIQRPSNGTKAQQVAEWTKANKEGRLADSFGQHVDGWGFVKHLDELLFRIHHGFRTGCPKDFINANKDDIEALQETKEQFQAELQEAKEELYGFCKQQMAELHKVQNHKRKLGDWETDYQKVSSDLDSLDSRLLATEINFFATRIRELLDRLEQCPADFQEANERHIEGLQDTKARIQGFRDSHGFDLPV